MTPPVLVGRAREIEVLDALVRGAAARGGAVVIRGEAGIGKSTLLERTTEQARGRGMLVLSTKGTEMETHLPFAGLHQLLRPILAGADSLPSRQRHALLAAFGMNEATAPELFLIALGALELLTEAAAGTALFLAAEDAQWLDPPSAEVLAFIGRRLESEPIVLLFCVRDGCDSPLEGAGLDDLRLTGLDGQAAAALLDGHAPGLAGPVRERILREAEGNPLALVELPLALETEQEAGAVLLERLPLTARLERAFAARQVGFPAGTRLVLLVGAANNGGKVADVLRGAALIDGQERTVEDFAPAIAAQLVRIQGPDLRCWHPLVPSALYQAATATERQAAHRALSEVFVDQPDRRAWHRAAAILEPDDDVAAELVAAAARARGRGAAATAIAALERAAELTVDGATQATRLLQAAELAFELGRADMVQRLTGDVEKLALGPLQKARMDWIREMFSDGTPGDAARVMSLVELAETTRADGDPDLALEFLRAAAARCFWADPGETARHSVVDALGLMGLAGDDPRRLGILAFADPVHHGVAVADGISRLSPAAVDADTARLLGEAANSIGAFDLSAGFLTAAAASFRHQGRLGLLPQVLAEQAWTGIHALAWPVAVPAAEEAARLADELGQPLWGAAARAAQAMLAGLRGDEVAAESFAAHAERMAHPMGASIILTGVQIARGVTALGAGRHAEAYQQLQRAFDPADPAYHYFMRSWGVGDLAEAAVHSGHRDEARAMVADLEAAVDPAGSSWFDVGLRYARPLLADDDAAGPLFQAALDTDLSRWPFYRARLLLAYGSWLRRRRQVAESRTPLRKARDAFDAFGVIPWGERARQELRAAGERSDRRAAEAWDTLSPQELQIAELAATGLSNREIGQRLYISHRTVGSHLYRLFPKLGITSRHELRTALAGLVLPADRDS